MLTYKAYIQVTTINHYNIIMINEKLPDIRYHDPPGIHRIVNDNDKL